MRHVSQILPPPHAHKNAHAFAHAHALALALAGDSTNGVGGGWAPTMRVAGVDDTQDCATDDDCDFEGCSGGICSMFGGICEDPNNQYSPVRGRKNVVLWVA